jgi:hypothetical protein
MRGVSLPYLISYLEEFIRRQNVGRCNSHADYADKLVNEIGVNFPAIDPYFNANEQKSWGLET